MAINFGKNTILAIDTSCDDTSVAILRGNRVLSNIVASQNQIHRQYGGVFPTMAKQAHRENIDPALTSAFKQARLTWSKIDAIAVTRGPGLAPALEVGINKAKELAKKQNKPLIAVNHIEAHLLSILAKANSEKSKNITANFPILGLVISGGHSDFILVRQIGDYQQLGHSIDDAAGECLDKVGRLLNLGYPAGSTIEKFAKLGDSNHFTFPMPMTGVADFNLSFSGLKTAARNLIANLEKKEKLKAQDVYDFSASFQKQVFAHINYKLERILFSHDLEAKTYCNSKTVKKIKKSEIKLTPSPINEIWLGGGVSANIALRKSIRQSLKNYAHLTGKEITLKTPYSKKLCSDNAAMIALAAQFNYQNKKFINSKDLERQPRLKLA